jgi:hypothetical protein
MKRSLPFFISIVCLAGRAAFGQGFELSSPDGHWKVTRDVKRIQLVDLQRGSASVLTLIDSLDGFKTLESTWSSDSKRVVLIGNAARGSCVWAAWQDGESWRRTLQTDFFPKIEAKADQNGGIVQEHRAAEEWKDPEGLVINGFVQFRNNTGLSYAYVLRFQPPGTPLTRDRGGYEEGEILGVAWTVEKEER